jgi:tetratricopeptide (TPR) repeat protein
LRHFDCRSAVNIYIAGIVSEARRVSETLQQSLFDLALGRHQQGRLQQAAATYTRILSLAPAHAGAHAMLSVIARQAGQDTLAVTGLRQAIAAAPRELPYRHDLLDLLHRLGRSAEAEACLREMCLLWPDQASLQLRRGIALRQAGQHAEAADHLRAAVALAPDEVDAHVQLGLCLLALGDPQAAASGFAEAIRLRPETAAAHNNLGLALMRLGRFAAAEQCFHEAMRLAPDRPMSHVNLGNLLRGTARLDAAEACFRTALRLQPDHKEAHYSLGSLLMISGRLAEGWPEMEWRAGCFPQRELPGTAWHGEPLDGRVLLLYSDQGFGDAIQFCRYVPALAQGGNVVLEVPTWLTRLMASLDASGTIVARDAMLPAYDVQCPLSRLPLIAGTTLENLPASVPYLHADAEATAAWRQRLAPLQGLRVGLVWAGNPAYPDDRRRSVPLAALAPLASVPGVVFVSLQKRLGALEAEPPPGMVLHDWTGELADFADTAALVSALDLVIAVDTAVAHLAGALGRPVWLLNRYDTDWRWLLDRDDSPWYPTLRQFRQTGPDGWDAPVQAMRDALSEACGPAARSAATKQSPA